MFKYSGQLKTADFKFKRAIVRGQRVKKCFDIFTFDIEVTSAWKYKNKLIPYEPGRPADFWNELDKYAIPYVWQCSFNDTVYYGRELQSFLQLLDDIPKDLYCIFWVHNLAYEFQFLLNIMTVANVFARAPHKPLKCSFMEYPNIEWRCSYMLTNMSLAQWGDQLGIQKLVGDLEYTYMRTPETPLFDYEMDYCERDCIVVYRGILEHLKQYKDVWDIPLTSTGKIRRVVKKRVTSSKDYMKGVKRTIPRNAEEYKLLQTIFAGGYTHANRKYLGDTIRGTKRGLIHHVDIASSYPTILCAYKFPYNKWSYIGRQIPEYKYFEDRAYIIKLHFTNIRCISWNTYISTSKSRGSGFVYDNGRLLAAAELWYTCTEQDYITICHNYEWDSMESEGTYCCQKKYLPKIFVDYVLQLYHDKTALKGVDSVRYAISKQYVNSLFGMCVTALFQSDVLFNADMPEQWQVGELDAQTVNEGLNNLRKWFNNKYFLSYSVGCWVTAYARRRLWECIEYTDKDLLYTDTDSLFYLNDYDFSWFNDDITERLRVACQHQGIDFNLTRPTDPKGKAHPMGLLEAEEDCEAFRTLGAKKYVEERKGKLYLTVAGVNKGAVKALKDIEDFREGFVFDKDNPHVRKLEHTYLSDMEPVTWPGGYKSDFKFGINMRPTGYELSIPDVYKDAINIMETGKINFSEYFLSKRRGKFRL